MRMPKTIVMMVLTPVSVVVVVALDDSVDICGSAVSPVPVVTVTAVPVPVPAVTPVAVVTPVGAVAVLVAVAVAVEAAVAAVGGVVVADVVVTAHTHTRTHTCFCYQSVTYHVKTQLKITIESYYKNQIYVPSPNLKNRRQNPYAKAQNPTLA